MRKLSAIVRQYQRARVRWKRLRRKGPSWDLATAASEVRALAWVLGVDPEHGPERDDRPRYYAAEMVSAATGEAPLTGVRLTRAWQDKGRVWWLLEVPADPDGETRYWAAFLSEQCVAELGLCFASALFGSHPSDMCKIIERQGQADKPTVTDLRTLIAQVEWPVRERQTSGGAA
jgi:hypothetical protein